MKQFEVTEDPHFDHKGDRFVLGDIRSHKDGQYFIDLGWAKCTETGKSGERIEGPNKIKPDNVKQVLK